MRSNLNTKHLLYADLAKRKLMPKNMKPIEMAREVPTHNTLICAKRPVFAMVYPSNVNNNEPNNPWMKDKPNTEPFNIEKAIGQWSDLKRILDMGSLVMLPPTVEELQDQVFVANLFMALPCTVKENTAILSNFRSEPRRWEEDVGRDFLSNNEFNVLQSKYFFEGEADLKFVRDTLFIGGYGIRTDIQAYEWMEQEFSEMKIIKVKMTDERQYHFDCLFFPLDNNQAMVCTELISPADVKQIESIVDIIDVPKKYGYAGSTNNVRCGNMVLNASNISVLKKEDDDFVEESQRVAWFTDIIGRAGLEPIMVNLSEFDKSGAALSCCVAHVNYVDYLQNNKIQKAVEEAI